MTIKQTYCDYDMSRGAHYPEGLGCFKGKVIRKMIIIYKTQQDTYYLCSSCYRTLRILALRQGYIVESKEV